MSVLRNPRHERFAQELAKGETADRAYQQAGYRPDRAHAARLAANGSIRGRLRRDPMPSRPADGGNGRQDYSRPARDVSGSPKHGALSRPGSRRGGDAGAHGYSQAQRSARRAHAQHPREAGRQGLHRRGAARDPQ